MFSRRKPVPLSRRVLDFLWPRRGWRRASVYIAHRVSRLPGTPYGIAAGFACGAAISFTPFIGFHFAGAALLALLVRGNLVASAIGTVVGNPWTFPVIWAWIYTLGQWLLGGEAISDLPETLSLHYIFERPLEVLWPMTVGGIPTAIVAWFAFFWPVRGAVAEYQLVRRRRVRRKAKAERQRARAAALAEREPEGL
ncbi:MAG: DUF2062 domain-containing protein [Kiloniellaceae bacterium]